MELGWRRAIVSIFDKGHREFGLWISGFGQASEFRHYLHKWLLSKEYKISKLYLFSALLYNSWMLNIWIWYLIFAYWFLKPIFTYLTLSMNKFKFKSRLNGVLCERKSILITTYLCRMLEYLYVSQHLFCACNLTLADICLHVGHTIAEKSKYIFWVKKNCDCCR